MMLNQSYNHTLAQVLATLENAHLDVLLQARLLAMETDLAPQVQQAMQSQTSFTITPELIMTCTDTNVKRCLRSSENILACITILGAYYRTTPEANVNEN